MILYLVASGIVYVRNVRGQSLGLYIDNGKFGYRDSSDSIIIKPEFDYATEFCDGCNLAVIAKGNYFQDPAERENPNIYFKGKFGLVSSSGFIIVPPEYDMFLETGPDYAIVGEGVGWLRFEEWPEIAEIHFKGVSGAVNAEGDTVIPFIMSQIKNEQIEDDEYWIVNPIDSEKWQILNHQGTEITDRSYDEIGVYSEGLFRIKENDKYGFMDTAGITIIPPIYNRVSSFKDGMALVLLEDEYFMIYSSGGKALNAPLRFDSIYDYSENSAKVKVLGKYGFIDLNGEFFIKPVFTEAWNFYGGISPVETDSSFGYLFEDGVLDMVTKFELNPIDTSMFEPGSAPFAPSVIDLDSLNKNDFFFSPIMEWDVKVLSVFVIEAIRWAPYVYYKYPHILPRIIAGEGTLAGRYLFNQPFWTSGNEKWEKLKIEIIFPLLSSEINRLKIWEWIRPALKICWLSMPELHRTNYLKLLEYLEGYYRTFPKKEVFEFLNTREIDFAYYHWDGTKSPYRKTSALIDRLILIHEVINEQEVFEWIQRINREIQKLESESDKQITENP